MGWLEVLALLKRVVPLLTRVAPMLETFLASRSGSRAGTDAEFQRVAGDIRAQLTATADQHGSVADLLAVQGAQIESLAKNLDGARGENDRISARLLQIETTAEALARTLRWVMVLLVIVLLIAIGLTVLVLRDLR